MRTDAARILKILFRSHLLWTLYSIAITVTILFTQRRLIHSGFWRDDFDFAHQLPHLSFWGALHLWTPGSFWCYRPVFLQYWWIGFHLWGQNAAAFHLASILLHVAVTLLLAAFVTRLTNQKWLGFAAGIFFLLFPACLAQAPPFDERSISAISWISSVSAILAAFFTLLTLHCWMSYRQTSKRFLAVLSLAFLWLALCSKEDAFSLPFALFAFDYLLWRGRSWLAPLAMAVLFALCDLWTDHLAHMHAPAGAKEFLIFAPLTQLRLIVEFNTVIWNGILPELWGAAIVVLVALGWILRRHRTALALWFWVLVAAVPVPFGVGMHAFATRFYYYPSMVLCAFATVAIWLLLKENAALKIGGATWLAAIAAAYLHWPYIPIEFVWMGLILTAILAIIAAREEWCPSLVTIWILILAAGSQLIIYGWNIPWIAYFLSITFCLICCAWKQWKSHIAPAILVTALSLSQPLIVLAGGLLLLIAATFGERQGKVLLTNAKRKLQKLRLRGKTKPIIIDV